MNPRLSPLVLLLIIFRNFIVQIHIYNIDIFDIITIQYYILLIVNTRHIVL